MRDIPTDIIDPFLRKAEAVKLKAYQDSKGVWTIGIGHTSGVTKGMVITSAQVDQFLNQDLTVAQRELEGVLKAPESLTEHQYTALLSFVFNLGCESSWTIWRDINSGDLQAVPDQLKRFVNAGGQKLDGLVNRREAEVELWNTPDTAVLIAPQAAIAVLDPQLVKLTPSAGTLNNLPTPPTIEPETRPLTQQKTFWSSVGAAVLGIPVGLKQIIDTVEPYAEHSKMVEHAIEWLATGSAAAAVLSVGFLAWRNYASRH